MGAFTYWLLTPLARVPSHGAIVLSHAQVAHVGVHNRFQKVLWELPLCEFSVVPFPKSELAYLPLVPNSQIGYTIREKEHLEFRVTHFVLLKFWYYWKG